MTDTAAREPRIVIVGAGPSGCFLAGALRRSLPEAELLVIDRLPSPFGLVRYGIAADHQSTKAITRQFDRVFTKERVRFAGNVRLADTPSANAVTLAELHARADAVVLATGLAADRPLNIPGGGLPSVLGAGTLTRVLNSHPDEHDRAELFGNLGQAVAIIGMGNVAVDLIRFLAKQVDDFAGSDVNDHALDAYHSSPCTRIEVLSRSGIAEAKCDPQMIRELGEIIGVRVTLHGDVPARGETLADETPGARAAQLKIDALRDLADLTSRNRARVELRFHFSAVPVRVNGEDDVTGIRVRDAAGMERDIPVDSVISAIGFTADEYCPETNAPPCPPDSGRVLPGRYRTGWYRRGPKGTVPTNRADALAVAAEIVADLAAGVLPSPEAVGESLLPVRLEASAVSYERWLAIDAHERAHALAGRIRSKLSSAEQMLEIAHADGASFVAEPTTPLTPQAR